MGTRGYRIIKFRGRYWIFYNHWDSYPEGLGQWLVDSIPADPEQYQKWLQSQRDFFAKWDLLLNEILTIQPEDMRKLLSDEPHKPIFYAAFDDRLQANTALCYASGGNDDHSWIEWTYTIDLDREVFSVNSGAHFTLNEIPGVWIEALSSDIIGNMFLLPQLVPAESVATLVLDPPSFASSAHHTNLHMRLVKPKNPDQPLHSYLTGTRLRWMLFNIIQASQRSDLSVALLAWHAHDLPFREFAFFILCLASGGDHLALLDQRCMKMPYSGAMYLGITTEHSSKPDIELATYLGVGYHMAGLPIGSAPDETKYWFEGALICLVPRLNCPGILEPAIAGAVEYGRAQCTRSSFNAVLISIEHLVLIKSFPDGTVDHTEVLPLIFITSHLSKDPQARYGDPALETFYTGYYGIKQQKVKEPDESGFGQLSQNSDQQNNRNGRDNDGDKGAKNEEHGCEDGIGEEEMREHNGAIADVEPEEGSDSEYTEEDEEEGSTTSDEENARSVKRVSPILVKDVSIKSTFMALVQFFEATTLESLRPARPNEARLPDEICEMVLHNVSDIKTYNACLKVSRRFRLICQHRSLVMDNIIFQDPLPKDQALSAIQEKEDRKVTSEPQIPPDFLAVEVSSSRQMNVWLRSGDSSDALTCFVVAGREWNRKTLVNKSISFKGLHLPLAGADKAGQRNTCTPVPRPYKEREMYGSEGTAWENAFIINDLDVESETRRIADFWNRVLRRLDLPLDEPTGAAWTLPPNTMYYFGTATSYDKNDDRHIRKFFHYLYLRVKNSGKFCNSQWDDIISEATEHLNRTQEEDKENCPDGGVVGGEEPFVILTVGLDVRLFKWEQGFDETVDEEARRKKSPSSALRELNPGTVLNVCEKSDREEIERFMKRVKEHKEVIMARKSERYGGKRSWY